MLIDIFLGGLMCQIVQVVIHLIQNFEYGLMGLVMGRVVLVGTHQAIVDHPQAVIRGDLVVPRTHHHQVGQKTNMFLVIQEKMVLT